MNRRKPLRLENFDYSLPGAYFITVCTKEKRCLLGSVVGADDHIGPQVHLSDTGRVVQHYTESIPGIRHYVVMPNHVHMVLQISAESPLEGPMWSSAPTHAQVSSLVRTWKTLITKELGISIWQRSFYDHIIRNEQDFVRIAQYIQDNPAKWQSDTYYSAY